MRHIAGRNRQPEHDPAVTLKLIAAAVERATLRDRKPHYLMREAIQQYVDREEKREQFRQGALAAWSGYQASGLHVTAEETDAWLAKLEAGEDAEAPECHG